MKLSDFTFNLPKGHIEIILNSPFKLDVMKPSLIILERFLDEDNFTLLKENYWLRERLYSSSNKSKYVLYHGHTKKWKSVEEIEIILMNQFQIPSICYLTSSIANYHIFRYYFENKNIFLDQIIFNLSDLKNRNESLTLSFLTKDDLEFLIKKYGDLTFNFYSKQIAYFHFFNIETALQIVGHLNFSFSPNYILPDPDISLIDKKFNFDDYFEEGEQNIWLQNMLKQHDLTLEEIISYSKKPMTLE